MVFFLLSHMFADLSTIGKQANILTGDCFQCRLRRAKATILSLLGNQAVYTLFLVHHIH